MIFLGGDQYLISEEERLRISDNYFYVTKIMVPRELPDTEAGQKA